MENLNKTIKYRMQQLEASEKRFSDIYRIMFCDPDLLLYEYTDGYRIKQATYGAVKKEIPLMAKVLRDKAGTGGYIALAMENCPEWVTLFWAILMSGNNVLLANMRMPLEVVRRSLNSVGCGFAVTKNGEDMGVASATAEELKALYTESIDNAEEWGDGIALFTSGTTLKEKVCVYNGKNIAMQVLNSGDIVRQNKDLKRRHKGYIKQLAFLPFYHIYGLTACYLWFAFFGRAFVFLKDYSADTILKTVRKHGVTHIFAVPMLWHTVEKEVLKSVAQKDERTQRKFKKGLALCERLQVIMPSLGAKLSMKIMGEVTRELFGNSIKFMITGGSYIRESALKLINSLGYPLYNGYGMTEIGITSVELRRSIKKRELGSIGRPVSSVQYAINAQGELTVKGSSLFSGMYTNGVYAPFKDEWFNTGDFAREQDGHYYLLGRKSDCVIGEDGENLNPDQIEKLLSVDYARRYCVIGLADEQGEEKLSLVIEPEAGLTALHIKNMLSSLYSQLTELPKAYTVHRVYFAQGNISGDNDIKVSRAGLKRRLSRGTVTLTDAREHLKIAQGMSEREQVSELCEGVIEVFKEVLGGEKIFADSHFVLDLGGSSMDYITLVNALEQRFQVKISVAAEDYCATPEEFARQITASLEKVGK